MLAQVQTFAISGLEPRPVAVEVDVRPGLPSFTIVGLADRAVREARERVRAAVLNSGLRFPPQRVTVNLAPASLAKSGPGFDLAIASGVLVASGQAPAEPLADAAVFGELGLDGGLRAGRGALAVAEGARAAGIARLMAPRDNAPEACLVEGLEVIGLRTLGDVVALLQGGEPPALPAAAPVEASRRSGPDLSDVHGHAAAVEALAIAAAGGHNVLLSGPPGVGKTMLARRLPTILPPMTREEALEVTRIHGVAGLPGGGGLVTERPFRAPHHTISAAGLVGGGSPPRPGEATLAHHGVLFLDELSEFGRPALEALRQPLEDGRVAVVRGQSTAIFPTRFVLAAATNPCPCGHAPSRRCGCSESDLERHRRRLSGPLLDRIDLIAAVGRPTPDELACPAVTSSAAAAERVAGARERQQRRLRGTGASCNAQLDVQALRACALLTEVAERTLGDAYRRGALSARGHDRALRVARTIADLAGRRQVQRADILAALGYRHDGEPLGAAA